jgi:Domain of unknown function (DUF4145)
LKVSTVRWEWKGTGDVGARAYTCGYCGKLVGPNTGYSAHVIIGGNPGPPLAIRICSNCKYPTFWDLNDRQYPGVPYGSEVGSLPDDIGRLYKEARDCYAAGAFTASVLACRKILMNIAVAQGADEGKQFIVYVEYLAANGYVPPNGRGWVDHIRKKGNEATHEIALMTDDDAAELISFVEMLLKFIYEFPARVPTVP